ncbi:serine/threonine-protein kinase [Alloscardovia criceti]|uniref:serine/threonine-protein kinase n=1 Tax=Alloscardovia criceti TaxID=356828 RepID=UPI00036BBC44|nr:serine/threonine-protein kinase [Alloscardovia criceti]
MAENYSALDLAPGNVVGGYTLLNRLDQGGMGTIWKVRDDGGNIYAMKILLDSLNDDETVDVDGEERLTARERFRREALALRRINHPGVNRIVDMELDDALAFIVTELIEGKNLRDDVYENGRYTAEDLENLARLLINAVDAVHDAGIIHRDIKPTNVMISKTGPILVDFGIAMGENESHVTRTGLVMGTPGFIAPEIIEGAESDEATDWWSVAAVLGFAATGKPIFGSKPLMTVLEREASGNADLTGLPPRTLHAMREALNPDRMQRCSAQELLAAIHEDALTPEIWDNGPDSAYASADTHTRTNGAQGVPAGPLSRLVSSGAEAAPAEGAEPSSVVLPFSKSSSPGRDNDSTTPLSQIPSSEQATRVLDPAELSMKYADDIDMTNADANGERDHQPRVSSSQTGTATGNSAMPSPNVLELTRVMPSEVPPSTQALDHGQGGVPQGSSDFANHLYRPERVRPSYSSYPHYPRYQSPDRDYDSPAQLPELPAQYDEYQPQPTHSNNAPQGISYFHRVALAALNIAIALYFPCAAGVFLMLAVFISTIRGWRISARAMNPQISGFSLALSLPWHAIKALFPTISYALSYGVCAGVVNVIGIVIFRYTGFTVTFGDWTSIFVLLNAISTSLVWLLMMITPRSRVLYVGMNTQLKLSAQGRIITVLVWALVLGAVLIQALVSTSVLWYPLPDIQNLILATIPSFT